ncbi:hypothetical protein BGZ83_006795, partial [Gryganskiella cystojenkinii]
MVLTSTDTPLCVASNTDTVYLATLDDSEAYRKRPPAVVIYKSQKNPTSLASIEWTFISSVLINGPIPNYMPLDYSGYFCAVTDSGAFAIFSGVKNTNSLSSGIAGYGHLIGLLYTPSPPSNGVGPVIGGPAAAVGWSTVVTTGYYPCIENSQQCSGYLYAVPGTSSSSFVLAMYNSTGYTFEALDGATRKFTTIINNPVSSPVTPKAYGFAGLKFVTVTSSGAQRYDLSPQGLPSQGNGTILTSGSGWDASALTECSSGTINRGAYASVHGYAYFSCVSNGKRFVFNTDGSKVFKKITTVNERTDATIKGIVPVPGPNGGESEWALAYTGSAGGLYGLTLSGSWEDQKAA